MCLCARPVDLINNISNKVSNWSSRSSCGVGNTSALRVILLNINRIYSIDVESIAPPQTAKITKRAQRRETRPNKQHGYSGRRGGVVTNNSIILYCYYCIIRYIITGALGAPAPTTYVWTRDDRDYNNCNYGLCPHFGVDMYVINRRGSLIFSFFLASHLHIPPVNIVLERPIRGSGYDGDRGWEVERVKAKHRKHCPTLTLWFENVRKYTHAHTRNTQRVPIYVQNNFIQVTSTRGWV